MVVYLEEIVKNQGNTHNSLGEKAISFSKYHQNALLLKIFVLKEWDNYKIISELMIIWLFLMKFQLINL